jgi:molecular chaperone DnaK
VKKAMEGEDTATIKNATESLTQASHKLAELMYAQAKGQQGAGPGDAGAGAAGGAGAGGGKRGKDDDVLSMPILKK